MSNPKTITLSAVEECLDNGMTRKEIADHFGISMSDCKKLFQNEKLKNRKPKKQPGFLFVDDSEGSATMDSDSNDEHQDDVQEHHEEEQEEVEETSEY